MSGTPSLNRGRDLIIVALPGVQRFIAESRSTSDVRSASEIVAGLARCAAQKIHDTGAELIFPPTDEDGRLDMTAGTPNRVVALAPAGTGPSVAAQASLAVESKWMQSVRQALRLAEVAGVPSTPGFPGTVWVCVAAGNLDYHQQWLAAQQLLVARRHVRSFAPVTRLNRELCSLSPCWPAEPSPAGLKPHEKDTLSAANWVKRQWRLLAGLDGFPSTASVSSATFRRQVLLKFDEEIRDVVRRLQVAARDVHHRPETAIEGLTDGPSTDLARWFRCHAGPPTYPDWWQAERLARDIGKPVAQIRDAVAAGRQAALALIRLMGKRGTAPPTDYLAVLVQDLDGMGMFLSGAAPNAAGRHLTDLSPQAHRRVARQLQGVASEQYKVLSGRDLLAVPVYAGGDDLMAFVPAATALTATRACHDRIPLDLPRASTAILFFHYQSGLRDVLVRARMLLAQAKRISGKHRLAVAYLRRSGATAASIQPWFGMLGRSAAEAFDVFSRDRDHVLSPRLVSDLERDGDELASLARPASMAIYRAELARLVARHTGGDPRSAPLASQEAARALEQLGQDEDSAGLRPDLAARVAVFLRQEAR